MGHEPKEVGAFPDPTEMLSGRLGNARWIWGGRHPRPVNTFRLFRREFTLRKIPKKVDLWAFAEFRYKLYINGSFVQTGPTPCQPAFRLVDHYDVGAHLQKGRNCVAFAVHCPGVMTGQWTLVNPGLLCYVHSGDESFEVPSNEEWKTIAADAWRHATQFCGYAKGFQEWHVLSRMPQGWNEPGFDDSRWESATVLPFFSAGGPEELRENYVGYPNLVLHYPIRLVDARIAGGDTTHQMRREASEYYTATRNRWRVMMGLWILRDLNKPLPAGEPLPEPIIERAEKETHRPAPEGMASFTETGDGTAPLSGIIKVPDEGHPFVLFDMGVVRSGLFVLEVESTRGGTVDIAWDDRLGKNGRLHPFRATPNCERVEVPAGRISWEGFFERGARFVQVIFRDFRGSIKVHRVGIRETLTLLRNVPEARFESSDDLLNRVWQAALETTRLYINGCGYGDPVRERCHWFHDDAMAMRMAFYCFGEWRSWRRGLELTAQSQNSDGSFPVISPGHFEDFNMVSGSCYWATQVTEYFLHTGDVRFAREMFPYIARHIAFELRFADREGLLYETPGRRFLSWADGTPRPPYKPGEAWAKKTRTSWGDFFDPATCGYNAIINTYWLWCLREAAVLAERLESTKEAKQWRKIFQSTRAAYERRFWDDATGLYRDNVAFAVDGTPSAPTFCESTIFMMMRAGLLEKEKGLTCLAKLFDPNFVCCRTSGGLDLSAVPPFLIEAGHTLEALELYRDRWGRPILAGGTTCGEEFFQGGGNSDCHIHGATPARDFLEYLAGIRLKGPMWSEVLFAPPSDGPDLFCSVPTPKGPIEVEIRIEGKERRFIYRAPHGCRPFRREGKRITSLKTPSGSFFLGRTE